MAEAETTTLVGRLGAWWVLRPAAGVLILGALLSLAAWWMVWGWETRQQRAAVREPVAAAAQALAETFGHLIGDVQVVAQFYDASERVTADAYARFTRPLLERHPGLRTVEWVPRVLDTEHAAFASRARAQGLATRCATGPLYGATGPLCV
ncbi:CHASE domain-containing protein [uncultured Thiodictyon sp.]|jgi:CHASE1-domain containing sensor protein|uniref:CHASE domain-containing protein n=1 Tax=uncultured Thiodictyon sp. TaxID=1846217 RepID=UPI0025FD3538|nr:CHASE domain-containing protein [uncultured Thiodictyon sp.]